MARRGGFTVIEAIVTVSVFSLFLVILMGTMTYGFRTFSVAVARSDVTTEARRLVLFMENELRTTEYFSMSVRRRTVLDNRRDGLCFVSMGDWSRPDSYDSLEDRPAWDRYVLYYATNKTPSGELVRMVVLPQRPEHLGSFPYPPFVQDPDTYLLDDPLSYTGLDNSNVRVLASKVKKFEATLLPASQEIQLKVLLRQNGIMSRRADKRREGGTFELNYRVHPQNTK